MNVVWLTTDYPWQESPILGVFHRTSARALVRADVDVTVISPTPVAPWPLPLLRDRWRRYARAPMRELDDGVRVVRPRYIGVPSEPDWAGTNRLLARAALGVRARDWPDARLIHGHYAAPVGMAANRLARSAGLPYVVTVHGDDVTSWPDLHPRLLDEYRRGLRSAARVIAVSGALAEDVARIAGVRAEVIPIGVDLARFAAPIDRGEARTDLGLRSDEIAVVMVAYLEPRKRVRDLVDAIHLVGPPLRLVIIGTGPEHGYRSLPGRVDYLGPRPNSDVPRVLAAADLTVLPSDREGLPTALVEAGAAGVPIIASRAGGTPELLAEDRGTLLDHVSADSIADALRAFLADRQTAERRAARLRDHVLAEYDAEASARRLASLYEDVRATAASR